MAERTPWWHTFLVKRKNGGTKDASVSPVFDPDFDPFAPKPEQKKDPASATSNNQSQTEQQEQSESSQSTSLFSEETFDDSKLDSVFNEQTCRRNMRVSRSGRFKEKRRVRSTLPLEENEKDKAALRKEEVRTQLRSDPPKVQSTGASSRNALLADIQKGARLKKGTQVNDRSAPIVDNPMGGDVSSSSGPAQVPLGGMTTTGPSLGGLFAGGFPTLRPAGQRDSSSKAPVCRSSSSSGLKPLWNPPASSSDASRTSEPSSPSPRTAERGFPAHLPLAPSSSAPPSPSHSNKPPTWPAAPPLPPPPDAPPPPPPPPPAFQDRPSNRPPPLPTCPPPPPPCLVSKPTWLPIQHSHSHHSLPKTQPSTPPPPPPSVPSTALPPPPSVPSSSLPDRSSGYIYPPPPSPILSEPSRFPILRDSPLGPPPPPPLPASFTPSCPTSLPPPPPKMPSVPSPAMRPCVPPLPPSYPCNAPTRRPPAVPRSAGVGRLAPPPAPPARSPSTELSSRTLPPPPPPLLPSSLRNGHLHSLDDFESKFQFHAIEDLPPPDEFKPFPRIYPSKENRVIPQPPGVRTHLR
ncbi:uncharacterized protein FYW47_010323 [Aplochiton taeniatus]